MCAMSTPFELPLVSVIMGVRYQREDLFLLNRAITSILNQTYQNLELLICENGSTEAVRIYLERFAEEDHRIRLIDGKGADSFAEKLNRCLRMVRDKWIARMDDDDVSAPQRIAMQVEYLREHPQVAFVGCIAQLEREGRPAGWRQLPERPTVEDFYFVQPFLHPTLMFRKEALEKVGGYSEENRCVGCEDYDLLLRLYEAGFRGENMQEPFFTYSLPPLGSRKRNMVLRWNEVKTRWVRFKSLGLLPGVLPYVVKPVAVGLLPQRILERLKERRRENDE